MVPQNNTFTFLCELKALDNKFGLPPITSHTKLQMNPIHLEQTFGSWKRIYFPLREQNWQKYYFK